MKQAATFDYKFPVDPGYHDMDSLKYDTSSYEELFGDLHEVTPQPHDPTPGTKMQSIEDFQDLDVDLLGLVQGNHPSGLHTSQLAHPANASVNSSNTNIMYPSTLPSPQLGTPMSQMSLTSQSISSSESLHQTPPMSMSVLSSHQQSPFQHTQLQQQVTQQLQHQQQPQPQLMQPVQGPVQQQQQQMAPQPAAAQARRQPWNMNMNMVSAPTPWGAWGLGGSAAAAAAAAALSQHNGVRVSHIPVSNNPAPRKKLSEHQLRVLEKVFNETPKPCLKTRTELERDLDLPKKNIQIWFQNRRAKEKQNIKKREGELANAAATAANAATPSSAVRQPHMAAAAAAAAINSDGPPPDQNNPGSMGNAARMKPVMHIPNANGKQVPTTTRQRPPLSLQRTFSTTSQTSINNNNHSNTPTTPIMGAPPPNPTTPVGLGGSTKHPSSTSLPALASTTNSDTPKRHRSNSSASFDRRPSTSAQSNQSTLVGMGISMPAAGHGHSRASSTSVLGPPLERKTPAETLAAASKMRRSNSFMGNMSLSRRGSETASAPGHARKNSMPMNHVTGQVGSLTSLTSIMTPAMSQTPSGQVTPNMMTPHTPQFSLDDGEVTPLHSPSAFTGHMMTPGPGPATPMSSQFRDRSFSQSSLYGPIAEDQTLEGSNMNRQSMNSNGTHGNNQPMQFGNPVEFDMGGGNGNVNGGMNFGANIGAGASRDSSVYTTTSNGFSQSQGSGSFTSLSTSVDSMSAVSMVMPGDSTPIFTPSMDDATIGGGDSDKRISVVKEEDDPYFQFVLSSMFPQDQAQDNDEFYNTMMGVS
ncbi:Homeobox protein [Yarrowia sp. C11]|nr:Homeobox protein [Yarrowia sp. C11]KAG5364316.1 Homeobox protein [Yarrowia sp. E02]